MPHAGDFKVATGVRPYILVAAFSNGWLNLGGAYALAGYYKDGEGFVYLNGTIKSGAAGTIFTLPAGFVPSEQRIFAGVSDAGLARLEVTSGGNVTVVSGGNAFLSLDNIIFKAV